MGSPKLCWARLWKNTSDRLSIWLQKLADITVISHVMNGLTFRINEQLKVWKILFDYLARTTLIWYKFVDMIKKRFQINSIYLWKKTLKVHDFEYITDLNQIVNETLPALKELKEKGKVKYIGINSYSLEKLK